MSNLNLALPEKIQEVLQPNQTAVDDERIQFPDLTQLNRVKSLSAPEVAELVRSASAPLVLDVRESEEYSGEFGHIGGSVLIPLKELGERFPEIESAKDRQVIVVCRAGVRSATAAAMLTALGFEHVYNPQRWDARLERCGTAGRTLKPMVGRRARIAPSSGASMPDSRTLRFVALLSATVIVSPSLTRTTRP
jgi:rhodanese-related sulfurtransferase